jgi:hypothetical protein
MRAVTPGLHSVGDGVGDGEEQVRAVWFSLLSPDGWVALCTLYRRLIKRHLQHGLVGHGPVGAHLQSIGLVHMEHGHLGRYR